jgi:lysophospholipase L1-like esterase
MKIGHILAYGDFWISSRCHRIATIAGAGFAVRSASRRIVLLVPGLRLLLTASAQGEAATRASDSSWTGSLWSGQLARRFTGKSLSIGVLNLGISGNRLLVNGAGDSAENRFKRDVLDQPNVGLVIFSDDPINDLGNSPSPSGEALIAGLQRLIKRAHEKKILFVCSTLTPFEGAKYWTPAEEKERQKVNNFIRSDGSGCDGIVDQDIATHDPAHPARYLPVYDSGDHLHPNDEGHKAIADAIDLNIFRQLQ